MNIYKVLASLVLGLFISSIVTGTALAWPWRAGSDTEEDKVATEASASVGYRNVSEHDTPGRALEYDSLDSSPIFNAKLFTNQGPHLIHFEFNYLNEDDFSSELEFDTKNMFLIQLRSERFFHNLDHIPYDNGYRGGATDPPPDFVRVPEGAPAEGSRPDGMAIDKDDNEMLRTYYSDDDPSEDYGLRLSIDEAKLKIKAPGYPAHFNLAYWRYQKKGDKQLRFVGENCATACHMQSKTRQIDRVTEEVKAGIDAHVGFVDLVVEGLYRTFHDRKSIPDDYFGRHDRGRDLSVNPFEHDEDPDSSVSELTFKANTAPSGGFVGSASFTIGERKNKSDLSSVSPVEAETDYYKTTADVTYTPGEKWTVNLRYRLLDMDSDNTDQFSDYDSLNENSLDVRNAMDIKRAWYEAIVNYRPSNRLTLKAELRREDIDRSNTGTGAEHHSYGTPYPEIDINPEWQLPDRETITRAKIGFNSRLLEKSALKLSGWLALQHSDDPAYGTSFENSQELFLAANYTPSPFWGFLANANLQRQKNNNYELHDQSLDRKKSQENLSLGTWLTPRQGLSFDLNYGYLHTAIDQDLLFGTGGVYLIPDKSDDYRQSVHTITLGMTWQAIENLSFRIEGYHIRSKADYDPQFASGVAGIYPFSSSELSEISEVDIRQKGLRGRLNWQINDQWSGTMEATYDDYDEQNNDIYDGSVQTTMVSISRRW